jgi:hypothetical protein
MNGFDLEGGNDQPQIERRKTLTGPQAAIVQ